MPTSCSEKPATAAAPEKSQKPGKWIAEFTQLNSTRGQVAASPWGPSTGLGWQEVWPGTSPSQRPNHRLWATIWTRAIFKIFNHRCGMDGNQPEQNTGRSTESKRHRAMPVESRWIEETSRES